MSRSAETIAFYRPLFDGRPVSLERLWQSCRSSGHDRLDRVYWTADANDRLCRLHHYRAGRRLAAFLGWRIRPLGAVLSVYAIATAFIFHRNLADQNQLFHFLKNIAVMGGLFQLMAFGAGNFSLDARRARKSST